MKEVDKMAGNRDSIPDYRYSDMKGKTVSTYKIFGLPPQWDNKTDPTLDYSANSVGRVYNKVVLENMMPIIFRIGVPEFMGSWLLGSSDDDTKRSIAESLLNSAQGGEDGADIEVMKTLLQSQVDTGKGTRYYDFKDSFSDYCLIVSRMIRFMAVEMARSDDRINEFKGFELSNYINKQKNGMTGEESPITDRYLSFYADAGTSYSDSFSTSTTESVLAGMLKKFNQLGREMRFLQGSTNSADEKGIFSSMFSGVKSFLGVDANDPTTASKGIIMNSASSILAGGNILFPEIWEDSTMNKSYNIVIKLHSPNGSPYSIFKHIVIPMFCVLGFSLPRYINEIGYCSPYLLKVYSKGFFNSDLCMVTSLDIKRSNWSIYKIPVEVEINISLKDLYPVMILASETTKTFDNNVSMYEYLRCMSGTGLIQKAEGATWYNHLMNRVLNYITNKGGTLSTVEDYIGNVKTRLAEWLNT